MKQYCSDLVYFLKSKKYIISVVLLLLLAYGFATMNPTIGIDDLEGQRYTGSGNAMLAAGRFGFWFWSKISSGGGPYYKELVGIALLFLGATNMCIIFRNVSRNSLSISACTFFSCIYLTYPLWAEIWEYTGTTVNIGGGIVFSTFAIMILYEFIHNKEQRKWWYLPAASFFMMMVCAGYESVVCVYIFLVCAILALQVVFGTDAENSFKEIFRQGMIYAAVLACGLGLRLFVHEAILTLFDFERQSNGATDILWGNVPAVEVICVWSFLMFFQYFLKAFIYFPLAELHIAGLVLYIISFVVKKRCGKAIKLPLFGMYLSLIILSLVQGSFTQYRSSQVFAVFVAFVVMIVYAVLERYKGKNNQLLRTGIAIMCCCLCIYQAGYVGNILRWNHVRSEEEAYVVREIGTDLQRSFSEDKPVVFVGEYSLSPYITEGVSVREDSVGWRIYNGVMSGVFDWLKSEPIEFVSSRQYVQSTVISMLTWGTTAFDQEGMWRFFKYYGYEYPWVNDPEMVAEAEAFAEEIDMPVYPRDGYIVERDTYLIVRIG